MTRLPDPERDRVTIRNPATWSMGNVLPLKNFANREQDGTAKVGCLILGRGLTRVHHTNVWALAEAGATSKEIEKVPQTEYATIDEMLAAGWRVD